MCAIAGLVLGLSGARASDVVVSIKPVSCAPGETATVWIEFRNATGVSGADLSLRLPDFAVPQSAEIADSAAGFLIASRCRPGAIHVALASTGGLPVDQILVVSVPVSIGREAKPGEYAITFERLQIYDSQPGSVNSWAVAGTLAVAAAPADRDHDGLPDEWETAFLGDTVWKGEEDSDRDGASNAKELIAGTDPSRADSIFAAEVEQNRGTVTLRWPARPDRDYEIEWSDDPLGSEMIWRPVYRPQIAVDTLAAQWIDDGSRTYRLPSVSGQRFYRIRAIQR